VIAVSLRSLKLATRSLVHFKILNQLRQHANTVSTALESGVDESVSNKFPGADVTVGSTGASNNQRIPLSEGGDIDPSTGKLHKASAYEGAGGKITGNHKKHVD
jgi:hypothetical protein